MQDMSTGGFPHQNGVKVIASCALKVVEGNWQFSEENAAQIEANWQKAKAFNPNYFNGVVHLMKDVGSEGNEIHASLIRTDFKSYLYWRGLGFPEAGVLDGFGSALIRSSDKRLILITQREGNVNHGYAYLPSGFIDHQDVLPDGTVDIGASVAREVDEEIGEAATLLQREEGFIAVREGVHLCFAVPFYLPMTSQELAARVAEHNAVAAEPEIDAVIPVANLEDLAKLKVLPHARALLEALFVAR